MTAATSTRTINGMIVKSTPLDPFRTLDLIPELTGLLNEVDGQGSTIGMFVRGMKQLGGGRLKVLLPQVLAGTSMPIDGGAYLSLGQVDNINIAFDGKMGMLPDVVAFAMEVSFADFLAGLGRIAKLIQKPSP